MRRLLQSCFVMATIILVPSAQAQLVGIESDTGRLYEISFSGSAVDLTLIKETGLVGMAGLDFFDGSLYGFTGGAAPTLYELSLAGDVLGTTPIDLPFVGEGALAIAPDRSAYGVNASFAFSPKLFHFDLDTGLLLEDLIDIETGPRNARDINGLGWLSTGAPRGGPSTLLALDRVESSLITIDPFSGVTAPLTSVNSDIGDVGGMAVSDDGQVYFTTSGPVGDEPGSNLLFHFDPISRQLEPIGSLGPTVSGAGISGLAVVPEPATISLLALGGLALLCKRRKRRLAVPCP